MNIKFATNQILCSFPSTKKKKSYVRIFHLSATNLITKGEYSFYHIINHFNMPLISYISRDYIISWKREYLICHKRNDDCSLN